MKDDKRSAEEGRPIFRDVVYVEIFDARGQGQRPLAARDGA